ncbi:hypothetical protein Y032_0387g476 [Ancylostoma ceylanicum]|uniref:Uncharacterized protein n=1 Tax=Ancylostoma ceylanicum TaxID=53326 RepID=A0A016RSL0_9BILA|nr:hypothetical protein Y032_0387g476 [Ancylostoma ceylanicum]
MTVHAALHLPKQDYSNLAVLVTSTGMCAILLQTQVFTLRREFFALGMSYSIGFIQFNDRPFKRSRVDSPSTGNGPFGDAIDRLVNDDEVPGHLKTVLAHLVKRTSSVEVLLKKNHELEERLKAELAEKSKLTEEIESSADKTAKRWKTLVGWISISGVLIVLCPGQRRNWQSRMRRLVV